MCFHQFHRLAPQLLDICIPCTHLESVNAFALKNTSRSVDQMEIHIPMNARLSALVQNPHHQESARDAYVQQLRGQSVELMETHTAINARLNVMEQRRSMINHVKKLNKILLNFINKIYKM